ncbi:MAG: hypothetical protein CM15mP114_09570 [Alphaproteobacteria bacterium]|nr:MAG: hypothetical protein CM15mP114_09570 [Alphaproteobacteria bacterium]
MFCVKPRALRSFPPLEVSNIKLGKLLTCFCKLIFVSAPPTKPIPSNLEILLSEYISNLPLSSNDDPPNNILPYAIDLNDEPFISPFKLPVKDILEFNFIKSAVKSRTIVFI